jgi:hypothetical protein
MEHLDLEHINLEHLGFPADVIPLQYQALLLTGDEVRIRFDYCPGDEIPTLGDSLEVSVPAHAH